MPGPNPSPQDHDMPSGAKPRPAMPPAAGVGASAGCVMLVTSDVAMAPTVQSALATDHPSVEVLIWNGQIGDLIGARASEMIVLLDDESPRRKEVLEALSPSDSVRAGVIVVSRRAETEIAVDAMRAGAIDFIAWPCAPSELRLRIGAGMERLRQMADQQRRVDRLKRICKRLNSARQEVSEQVETLCDDLAGAYDDLAEEMSNVTLATEFGTLVQQELDVESLLRTTLEFLLAKMGPTNAAVFLPTGHDDFDLGAYVNYDVPKETADFLLDHLADVIAPRFEDERSMCHFETEGALRVALDDDAQWLSDSEVVVFACHEDDDCLAIITLFRDRSTPFTEDHLAQLEVMRDVFGKQLAKVVRIHHRHLPAQDNWPGFDIEGEDGYGGLAA